MKIYPSKISKSLNDWNLNCSGYLFTSWRTICWIMSTVSIVIFVSMYLVKESPYWLIQNGRKVQRSHLTGFYQMEERYKGVPLLAHSKRVERYNGVPLLAHSKWMKVTKECPYWLIQNNRKVQMSPPTGLFKMVERYNGVPLCPTGSFKMEEKYWKNWVTLHILFNPGALYSLVR